MDVEEILGPPPDRGEPKPVVGFLRKYKFWSKTEAAQQLLRKLGAFKDTVEVNAGDDLAALVLKAAGIREGKQ
jgi:hypothetical protein